MNKRRILPGIMAGLGMLILILDNKTALLGASEGITICIQTVIPSLFPFFLLSGILVKSLMGIHLPILRPIGRLMGIPEGAESLLISGFLGGYPVGAKCIRDAWTNGGIPKQDADRMLWCCCNAGPAFLFGMAAPLLSTSYSGWILWGIHMFSALLIGYFLPRKTSEPSKIQAGSGFSLSESLVNALKVTAQVCGWILIFRVLLAFLDRWFLWLLPLWLQVTVTGLLELSNGCLDLTKIDSESVRFLLCSGMLSLGGCCVLLQTLSVTQGLDFRGYCLGKLLQTAVSILLSAIYLGFLSPLWLMVVLIAVIWKKSEKTVAFPQPFVYNGCRNNRRKTTCCFVKK